MTVIAITGSYGKTSTKEFLKTILATRFKVISTKEHQNSEIGVANCILNDLDADHEIFIAEVGAYNKGKVREVCSMIRPAMGIVTGVNEQHMALFGSLNNLLSAEGGRELAQLLPDNGVLVLNGDNKYCLDLYKRTNVKKRIYNIKKIKTNSDIWTEDVIAHRDSVSFLAITKDAELAHIEAKVLGKQNVQNLLAAILVAKELGMSLAEIGEACKNITQEQAGITLRQNRHGIYIIDSSYSSNPDGVKADLDYLDIFDGKKAVVMPCIIELGKKSAGIHEKIGQKIGKTCDLAIITTKDKFKEIKKGAVWSGMKKDSVIFSEKSDDIAAIITTSFKSGDAVLLEGRVPQKLIHLLMQ